MYPLSTKNKMHFKLFEGISEKKTFLVQSFRCISPPSTQSSFGIQENILHVDQRNIREMCQNYRTKDT